MESYPLNCLKKNESCKLQEDPAHSITQYLPVELPDVQAGCRKGRGTRGQLANICWIIEKARE